MVTSMTNRLLAVVMALAFTSGIVAHAAAAPERPIVPAAALPAASDLPLTIGTAASHLTETATGTIDPSGAIRDAYQRDHVALERLRQQGSQLKGSAHPDFNQYISDQEDLLTQTELTALATTRPSAASTIATMDNLVAAAQAKLAAELQSEAKPNGGKPQAKNGSKPATESSNGQGHHADSQGQDH